MDQITYRDVSSNGRFMMAVKLGKRRIGTIYHDPDGYRYYPKGMSKESGDAFATLAALQRDIEGEG